MRSIVGNGPRQRPHPIARQTMGWHPIGGRLLRHPEIEQLGAVKVMIGSEDDAREELIDDAWLRRERKQIEDLYTFQIDNFGRVILREDRDRFDAAVREFRAIVESYHAAVRGALDGHRQAFRDDFVSEFLPRWQASPPAYMSQWGRTPDEPALRDELKVRADEVFDEMMNFAPPSVRLVEKNVSPKNVEDARFVEPLRRIMEQRRVPKEIIESLFASGGAAPEQPDLLN